MNIPPPSAPQEELSGLFERVTFHSEETQLTGHDAGYLAYWRQNLTHARPPGPLWFIWLLLLFDILATLDLEQNAELRILLRCSPTTQDG